MKYILFFLLIPFSLKANFEEKKQLDTISVGYYIDDIYDINYVKGTYRITLFAWVTSTTVQYNFNEFLDIHHAIDKKFDLILIDSSNVINGRKIYWSEVRLNLEVLQKFDIRKFPFDKQDISLGLEFTYNAPKNLKINLSNKSLITPNTIPNDWKIISSNYTLKPVHYNTNFGDESVESFDFNVLSINYTFGRESVTLFIKLFTALFISFLIACTSIFLPNAQKDSKISMIIGGLFGSITNKYITDSLLPINNSWNLSDKIHILTIFYLLFLSVYSIYEQRNNLKDNIKQDVFVFLIIIVSYISCITYFIY
jgi:hypothetical protein